MPTLDEYKVSIQGDIDAGTPVGIISSDENHIRVWDDTDFDREFSIYDPAAIDAAWLRERLIVTPSAESLDFHVSPDALCSWIAANVEPDMLVTLENMVLLGDDDEDYEFLRSLPGNWYYELESSELPCEDQLGIHWFSSCKVFAHLGNIASNVQEMITQGNIEAWEEDEELAYAVLTTLVHEIRHLAQANPYLPEEVLRQQSDDETDAEGYARRIVTGNFSDILVR